MEVDAYIKGIAYYLPEKIVTNEQLVKDFPQWSVEKVTKKVGVCERHIAADDETSGDMAIKAAQNLFQQYSIKPGDVDYILFCTQSPDYYLPTTACIIQEKLGIPTSCGALDFNLGCSGYVYGLSLAKGLICAGIAKNVLLLTGETYNKYIHPSDKGNRSIFGDAATATWISSDGFAKIGNFSLGTDGKGASNLIVMAGGARHHAPIVQSEGIEGEPDPNHLYMNGSEIFNFTLEAVPPLIEDILIKNGLEKECIGYFIFHQANKFMLDTLRKVCSIPKDLFYVNLSLVGNTVSSTLPIALKQSLEQGRVVCGMQVLVAGFGVGYSWGGCVLSF